MKTLMITAAAVLVSSSAFAMQAAVNEGNYSASVEQQFMSQSEDLGPFVLGDIDTMTTASIADEPADATLEQKTQTIFEEKSGR